jgi:hypothetical protein
LDAITFFFPFLKKNEDTQTHTQTHPAQDNIIVVVRDPITCGLRQLNKKIGLTPAQKFGFVAHFLKFFSSSSLVVLFHLTKKKKNKKNKATLEKAAADFVESVNYELLRSRRSHIAVPEKSRSKDTFTGIVLKIINEDHKKIRQKGRKENKN